jgi:putative glycosyltransferase (TIGR04372 family)
MPIFYKLINNIFFSSRDYIFIGKLQKPAKSNYFNLFTGLGFFFYKLNMKVFFIILYRIIFKFTLDILKFIYLPFIIIIYFTKIRFVRIDYSQIGTLLLDLDRQVKYYLLNNKIPIICIPKSIKRSYIKKIFKNLVVIDNIIINILFLPLINSRIVSSDISINDLVFNKCTLFEIRRKFGLISAYKDFYKFKPNYNKDMEEYFYQNFLNYDLKKTFVLHIRDNNYYSSSYIRSANENNYIPAINFLLKNNYYVIRIVHSKSNKLSFSGNYCELNCDIDLNQLFQFYLIANCKGFLACNSGPAWFGSLFNVPMLIFNYFSYYSPGFRDNDLYVPKKILNFEGKTLTYKQIFDLKILQKSNLTIHNIQKNKLKIIENSENEILNATKEFIELNYSGTREISLNQINFKKNIPNTLGLKNTGNISDSYIKNNSELFEGMLI